MLTALAASASIAAISPPIRRSDQHLHGADGARALRRGAGAQSGWPHGPAVSSRKLCADRGDEGVTAEDARDFGSDGVDAISFGQPHYWIAADVRPTPTQKQLFERLVGRTLQVSDGIWFGTATDLDRQWRTGGLRHQQGSIEHQHLVLWGALDPFIPKQDMDEMSARMPDCRLTVVPGVGHSMIIERPEMYAQYFVEFFSER